MSKNTIIGVIVLAILVLAITIVAVHFAGVMNDNMAQFSHVEEPVSVLGATFDK